MFDLSKCLTTYYYRCENTYNRRLAYSFLSNRGFSVIVAKKKRRIASFISEEYILIIKMDDDNQFQKQLEEYNMENIHRVENFLLTIENNKLKDRIKLLERKLENLIRERIKEKETNVDTSQSDISQNKRKRQSSPVNEEALDESVDTEDKENKQTKESVAASKELDQAANTQANKEND
ncbi:uncharacterized protein LOC109863485, partial [Pseudomyrmex gracilis]|uniref:uncharacterized protein LOC109863485 n=1 Tax=Pseudomyrmex gracilis TaxID=219809 RepID=UPI000995C879